MARHLNHSSAQPLIHCWHDGGREVDFVLRQGGDLFALEVKSGTQAGNVVGLDAFTTAFPGTRPLVIGTGGVPLETWFGST